MRNSKHIEAFIDQVKKEAEEAAQMVFDKYQSKLEYMIKTQLCEGDRLRIGMGVCFIKNKKNEYVGDKLSNVLIQHANGSLSAAFNLGDIDK